MALDLPRKCLAELFDIIQAHAPQMEVLLYGSRISGRAHAASDLDLVIRNPRAPDEPFPGLGALREAITESTIPILVDIHDWALLPAAFRRDIAANNLPFAPAEHSQAAHRAQLEGKGEAS